MTESGPRLVAAKLTREHDRFAAASEARLLRAWANKGLAPPVLATNGRLTVLAWVDAEPVTVDQLPAAAETLYLCHTTESSGLPDLRPLLEARFGKMAVPGAVDSPDSKVMSAAEQLLAKEACQVAGTLHADCHPRNMLFDGQRVLAIDPLGAIGDPCFDLAMLAVTSDDDPYRSLNRLRAAYPGPTETLAAWFAWCVAFRWRVERGARPGVAQQLERILGRLSTDPRWWRLEVVFR